MRRVFTKLIGSKVDSSDLSVVLAIADSAGRVGEIAFAPEVVPTVAHEIMGSAGYAEHLAEEGVPATPQPNEPIVKSALTAAAAFVSERTTSEKRVLTVGCPNGAEYNFALTEEQTASLKSQL